MNQDQSFTFKINNLPRFDPRKSNFDSPFVPYDFVRLPHGILGNRLPQLDPCITISCGIDLSDLIDNDDDQNKNNDNN